MFSGIMKPMCVMNQWHKFLYLSDFILIGCYLSYPMLFYLFPALSVCSQSSHKISSFKVILKILIFLRVRHLMSYSWFIIRITLLLKKIYIYLSFYSSESGWAMVTSNFKISVAYHTWNLCLAYATSLTWVCGAFLLTVTKDHRLKEVLLLVAALSETWGASLIEVESWRVPYGLRNALVWKVPIPVPSIDHGL